MEIRGNTLPSSEQIRLAIREWWPEGGLSNLIVTVLRKHSTQLDEAREVAERLAGQAEKKWSFTEQNVEDALEMVRAVTAVHNNSSRPYDRGPNEFDSARCVFEDGVACPQCSRIEDQRVVHGHLLVDEELKVFFSDWRRYVAAIAEERENGGR